MLKYHVTENGEQPIIFISGAGISKWMWNRQMDLSGKLVTFDLPGHGENCKQDFVSIQETVHDILEILTTERIKSAIFVGHSIGAQMIMYMMEHEPQVIEKALVISGLNKPSKWMNMIAGPMVAMSMPLVKNRSFSKVQAKQLVLPEEMFEDYYRDSLLLSKTTLINIMKENQSFEFKGTDIDGRDVFFLVGSKEVGMIIKSANKNQVMIEGSKLLVYEAGHGIPYEQADQLNLLIEKLISQSRK